MKDSVDDAVPAAAWAWGDYRLFPAERRLTRGGRPVEVEDRVLDLLVLLLKHRDHALDRQAVIAAIWGKRPVSDATLRQLVYKARRAIGDDGEHQSSICTLYGRSVQWVAPVEEVPRGEASAGSVPSRTTEWARSAAADVSVMPGGAGMGHAASPGGPSTPSAAPAAQRPAVAASPVPPAVAAPPLADAQGGAGRRRAAWLVAVLVLLAGAGLAAWAYRHPLRRAVIALASAPPDGAPAASPEPTATLAVLPFLDLDRNQDQRYLSDGLTEELINRLARMPHLRVTARTSSFVFRDKQVDVRDAARQLGVRHVIEGSVQRSGQTWRVRVALVDARNGYELWAGEYNAGAGDLLGMEDQIARSVVTALYPKLAPRVLARAVKRPHVASAAHDFYLVGLQYLSRRTTSDIDQAIAYFQRAAQIDPNYADAWSGEAIGYAILRDYNSDAPPDTHYGDALAAAVKAVALDPQSARGHMVLAQLYEVHWQWARARREFELALQLDPSDATAHQWYAIYFWLTGDMQSALQQMRVAYTLDPLSLIINVDLSRALLFAGDVDGAIRQGEVAVALAPRSELPHLFLAAALQGKGRYAEAVREIRTGMALASSRSEDLAFLGQMEWAAGDHADARRLLNVVEARARQHYVSGVSLASIEWPLGEKDRAFANLDRAAADHDHLLMTVSGLRDDPWCSDPRFRDLLKRMNLPVR